MHTSRIFLALAIAALTGFGTVHADNGATAQSTAALPHAARSGGSLADRLRPPHRDVRLAELNGGDVLSNRNNPPYSNPALLYLGDDPCP